MKKFKLTGRLSVILTAVLIFLFFSCKSLSRASVVKPLELLNPDHDIYIAVPKAADSVFLKAVIKEFSEEGVSSKDLDQLVERIEKVYCGLSENNNSENNLKYDFQVSVTGNIPKVFAPQIFSKKNGFSKNAYKNAEFKFDVYSRDQLNISIPENNLICLSSSNVISMLDTYVTNAMEPENNTSNKINDMDEYLSYLESATDEIRFFTNKPSFVLSQIPGISGKDLKLDWVKGSFFEKSSDSGYYNTKLYLHFNNSKYLKAGKVILGIGFALFGCEVSSDSDDPELLIVNGLKIKKSQVFQFIKQ